jgi:hypothetical protein
MIMCSVKHIATSEVAEKEKVRPQNKFIYKQNIPNRKCAKNLTMRKIANNKIVKFAIFIIILFLYIFILSILFKMCIIIICYNT